MEILTENVNGITVVSLKGRLDINTHGQLEAELNALAGQGQTKVLVDVKDLDYISSAGLRVLLSGAKQSVARFKAPSGWPRSRPPKSNRFLRFPASAAFFPHLRQSRRCPGEK